MKFWPFPHLQMKAVLFCGVMILASLALPTRAAAVNQPDLTVGLIGPTNAPVATPFQYTIAAANNGAADASGVTVQLTLPAGLTFISGSGSGFTASQSGGIVTFSGGSISAGGNALLSVSVSATASGVFTTGSAAAVIDPSNTITESDETNNTSKSAISTNVSGLPDLKIGVTGPPIAGVGSQYVYQISAGNAGPVDASGVTATLTLPPSVTFVSGSTVNGFALSHVSGSTGTTVTLSSGTLPAGATAIMSVTVAPNITGTISLPVGAGIIDPNNTITESDETNNTTKSSVDTIVTLDPDLSLSLVAQPKGAVGVPFNYNILLSNIGPVTATGASAQFTIPSGLTYLSSSNGSGFTASQSGSVVTFSGGSLTTGSTAILSVIVSASTAGTYTAPAGAAVADPLNSIPEVSETNNATTSAVSVTFSDRPDLTISLAAAASTPVGAPFNYTMTVSNVGTAAATGIAAVLTLPPGVSYVSASGNNGFSASQSGSLVTFSGGSLNAGSSASLTVTVTTLTGGTLTTPAGSALVDPNNTIVEGSESNNASTAVLQTQVSNLPDLTVAVAAPATAVIGSPFNYTLTLSNPGGLDATGVSAQFTIPAGLTYVSATGAGFTANQSGGVVSFSGGSVPAGASATVTVTVSAPSTQTYVAPIGAAVIDPGNTVTEVNETNNSSPAATSTVVSNIADLTISVAAPSSVFVGTPFNYTIQASNIGSASASGIAAQFTLPTGLTYVSSTTNNGFTASQSGRVVTFTGGSLGAGASALLTVTVSGTAPGTYTAAAGAAVIDPSNSIPEASETNNVSPTTSTVLTNPPDLTIALSAPATSAQGSLFAYTLTVSNLGLGNASGIAAQFTLPAGLTYVGAGAANGFTATQSGNVITFTGGRLTGGASATLTVSVNPTSGTTFTAPIGAAIIDPANTVAESNESNNSSTSAVTTVLPVVQTPALALTGTQFAIFTQGDSKDTVAFVVSNTGSAVTSGAVTLVATLPAGLTAISGTGSGWSGGVISGSTVTSLRTDALASGSSYPAFFIAVSVDANCAASVTERATVSGGGSVNSATASIVTAVATAAVIPKPDLTISGTSNSTFAQRDTNDTYTFTVLNSGSAATSGAVTVTDTLPAGLVGISISGSGWTPTTTSGTLLAATRSDALASGASYPPLTVRVSVNSDSPLSVTNTAVVSGGSDSNLSNNSASVPTAVSFTPPPATHLLINAPTNGADGTPFSFTVTAADDSDNPVPTYSGTVHFTSSDAHASLPADAALTSGTGLFTATLTAIGGTSSGIQTITATDSASLTGSSAIFVAFVQPPPPVGVNDIAYTSGTSSVVINVLANDTRNSIFPLSVTKVTQPQFGRVSINSDNTVTYTPTGTPQAKDTFIYYLADGVGGASTGVVRVYTKLVAAMGSYDGLVTNGTATNANTGYLTLTVGAKGAYTGKLLLQGLKHPLSGTFPSSGSVVTTISRLGQKPLQLSLSLDVPNSQITGSVAQATDFTSPFVAGIRALSGTLAGNYTMVIQTSGTATTLPQGSGYATMSIDTLGNVAVTGKLSDGTAVTGTTYLKSDKSFPLYFGLYGATFTSAGSITGTVAFANVDGVSDAAGTLAWFKPVRTTDAYFKPGFTTPATVLVSKYTAPALNTFLPQGTSVMNLSLSEADIPVGTSIDRSAFLSGSNKVTISPPIVSLTPTIVTPAIALPPADPAKVTMTFTPKNGLFAGTFKDPKTAVITSFSGVIFQKQNGGEGYFLSSGRSGVVELHAFIPILPPSPN